MLEVDRSFALTIEIVFVIVGGSFFVSAAQSAFNNQLLKAIATNLPEVDPTLVLATGATDIRRVFDPSHVPIVVEAYMTGLRAVFAITVGAFGVAAFIGCFGSWKKLHSKELMDLPGAAA